MENQIRQEIQVEGEILGGGHVWYSIGGQNDENSWIKSKTYANSIEDSSRGRKTGWGSCMVLYGVKMIKNYG